MKLQASRTAQYPLASTFEATITDTMVNTSGVEQALSATAGVFDAIKLPQGATIIGGELIVDTVSDETGTATVAVGDASSATRYLAATNIKAAARTALTLTGYRHDTGEDIRITLANQNGDAVAGKFRVNVLYVVAQRANESQTH